MRPKNNRPNLSRPRRGYPCQGIVLLEVLVAVAILGTGLTWVIRSYLSSLRASAATSDYTLAMILAENKMQEIIKDNVSTETMDSDEEFAPPFERFRWQVETQSVEAADRPPLEQVRLSLKWQTGTKDNEMVLTTYLLSVE